MMSWIEKCARSRYYWTRKLLLENFRSTGASVSIVNIIEKHPTTWMRHFLFFFVKNHSFPFGFFFVSEQFHVPVVLCISEGGGIHWRRRAYSIISPDLRTESQARPAYENLFGKKVDIGVSAPSNNTSIKRFFSSISFLLGRTMSFRWTPWMGRCAAVGPTGRAWRWGSCARSACRRRRQRRWGSSRAAARSSRPGARHKASVWFWIDRGLARFHRVLQDYKLFSIIY